MKTLSIKAKLINCFFAFTLVTGLCVPSLASYAYAEPEEVQAEEVVFQDGEQKPNKIQDGINLEVVQEQEEASDSASLNNTSEQINNGEDNVFILSDAEKSDSNLEIESLADSRIANPGFVITGGVENVDYAFESINYTRNAHSGTNKLNLPSVPMLVVKTSTPLTIANVNPSQAINAGIRIAPGVDAFVTLNNVNIAGSVPFDIVTNSKNPGTTDKTLAGEPTRVHLQLADGSTNTLFATADHQSPGIRCGEGSELYIDDALLNRDANNNDISPVNGFIPIGTTYRDVSGTEHTVTGKNADNALINLQSPNPGRLDVTAGYRCAGIGAASWENSGKIVINGGDIVTKAWALNGDKYNTDTNNWDYGDGAGIGGAYGGHGTELIFNGGKIDAHGSYHGSAIGAGMYAYDAAASSQADWAYRSYPFVDAIRSGLEPSSVNPDNTATRCGNITINGGFIKATGGLHGNAFGQGCGGSADGCTILITGGTLLPTSNSDRFDIGGVGGDVIITGGSVNCNQNDSSVYKFQGNAGTGVAYGAYTVDENNEVHPVVDKKVKLIKIDLSADLRALEGGDLNREITSWNLTVKGENTSYGAPARFNNGFLYLWLTEEQARQEVRVELSYKGNNGESVPVEPLFRNPGSTEEKLKRYVYFDIQDDFFNEDNKTTSNPRVPLNILSNYEQKKYGTDSVDDEGMVTINALNKPYDGLPYSVRELTLGKPLYTGDVDKKTIWQNITYVCQYYNEQTQKLGSEISMTTTPADSGLSRFTLTSTQYSNDAEYKESYYGHRAYGWCEISRVPAVVTIPSEDSIQWGNLDSSGHFTPTRNEDDAEGNCIKVEFNIRSKVGTALTCGVPTGEFQLMLDGAPVGDRIPLTEAGVKSQAAPYSTVSTFAKTESGFTSDDNIQEKMDDYANNNGRARVDVCYYLDPTKNDGFLETLEERAQAKYASMLADGASEEEAVKEANKHEISVQYIPDKNYIEGIEEGQNPDNIASGPTTIVPVNPGDGIKVDEDKVSIDRPGSTEPNPDPSNPNNPGSNYKVTSVVALYSSFHGTDDAGNLKDDFFKMEFETKSAAPIKFVSSNPAVADIVYDDKGQPVYDENGQVKVQVKSCGSASITMTQASNAIYKGQTHVLQVTVIPDPAIVPETEVRVVWENITHPGLPAAPGDVLEYTVVGSNLTEGSSWQEVVLGDEFNEDLEFVRDSVKIAKNFASPENLDALSAEDIKDIAFDDLASDKYSTAKNSITLKDKVVNSIYGGQSSAFKFQVKVKDNLTNRKTMTGENPPTIPNTPTVDGSYGVTETKDLVPGQDGKEDPKKLEGDNATKVYPIEADEIPEAVVIPKDPILPGNDPSDPNNPGKVDPDISVNKTAKNLTHPTGNKALVGDEIEYSITVENKGKDTCYYWPIIKDTLPLGLAPVAGSFELTKVDGSKVSVPDSAYQASTHTISLYVDDLYGNEKTTLSFKCTVTPEATDIANTAQVIGTTPSDKWKGEHPDPIVESDDDPETSYIKFDANGGSGAPKAISGETSSSIDAPFPTTEPTREGYEFVGWNTQANGCGLGITSYPSHFLSKPGSIYYYAQWKKLTSDTPGIEPGDPAPVDPTQFSYILFAANGGTGAPEGIKGEPASAITDAFPTAEPTAPDGYKFVGWFTERDTGDKVEGYPDNFPFVTDADSNAKPTTVTFYAHWQKTDDPTDTTPPAGGDPDPVDPLGLVYIKFDANGGKFVVPVVAQAEGDDAAPVWSTAGLTGTPKGSINDIQKNTFPSKKYGPVVRSGYTFTGWYDHPTEGNEATAYGDSFADTPGTTYYYAHWVKDPEPTWPPTPGQPFSPDPKIPASEYPWDDPDNPFDWDKYLKDTPQIDTPEPADVGKVMPADPDLKDLRITLSAKNETRMDGYTYVGDEVTYTITIENLSSPEKSWLDVIARADIPEGLKFMPGSIYLTTATGEVIHVDDNAYNDLTRILALNVGDIAGGETIKVVFKAEVTVDAINKDIGMTAKGYGTLPSEFDVEDESYVKPEPGTAFVPAEGWDLYELNHKPIFNPEKVYPSEKVTAQEHVLGTPEQQAEADKLAKTSDFMGFAALGVGAIAIVAAVVLILARKRIQKK